jgi:hypothetical protein
MMKIKKIIFPLVFLAMAFVVLFISGRDGLRLNALRSGSGWGYSISVNSRTIIMQPYIPAIEGERAFSTRDEALKAGRLVMKRIRNHEDFRLSVKDLHDAGILSR